MTMTKKHYIKIANIINLARNESGAEGGYICSEFLIGALSVVFKTDNPNFNKETFVSACKEGI